MLKKTLAIVLAAALAVGTLTACGGAKEEAPAPAATEEKVEEEAPAEEEKEEAPAEEEAEEAADTHDGKAFIKFATNPEFPPFEYITTDGVIDEFDGIDMAIVAEIGKELNCDITMESMEFDSLIMALSQGQIDATIAGMTVTDERKEAVDFTTPYYTATQVMIVKEDSDIASAADMDGKKIAVVQGYTGEICVQDLGYEYTAFKKGTECIMDLVNGKCDVVVIDSATAQQYVSDNEGLKIVEDEDSFGAEEYAIAVSKGNEELLTALDGVIKKMLEDGRIAEISAKYMDAEIE